MSVALILSFTFDPPDATGCASFVLTARNFVVPLTFLSSEDVVGEVVAYTLSVDVF